MEELINKRNLAYEQQFNDIAKQAIIDSGLAKKEHREVKSYITQDMIDEYNNEQELLQQGPIYKNLPLNIPKLGEEYTQEQIDNIIETKINDGELEEPITKIKEDKYYKIIQENNNKIKILNNEINKQNNILNKILKTPLDVNFTNAKKEEKIITLTNEIKNLNKNKNNLNNNINKLQNVLNRKDIINNEIEKVKQNLKNENLKIIKEYQKEIQTLNPQKYIEKEKLIGETEQEYLDRINEELKREKIVNPVLVENQTIDKFKRLMKGIIRNNQKIDNVLRHFINKNELDKLNKINIRFEKFKNKYIKNFGENEIPTNEIIDFINEEYDKLEETKLNALERTKLNETRRGLNKDETLINETFQIPESSILTSSKNNDGIYREKFEDFKKESKEKNKQSLLIYLKKYISKKKGTEGSNNMNEKQANNFLKLLKGINENIPLTVEDIMQQGNMKKFIDSYIDLLNDNNIDIIQLEQQGLGIRKDILPKNIEFGKIKLMLDKLYHENILSVKYNSNVNIPGFTNTKVSDQFVKIIMDIYDNKEPKQKDLHNLNRDEKALFDKLMFQSKLHKKYNVDTIDDTSKELKNQLEIIVGEIEAGNNGQLILNDLYKCVNSLVNIGAISRMNGKRYFEEIMNKYFDDKPLGKHTLKK